MIFKMGDNRMFGKGRTFMEDESCCTTPINVIKSELKQLNYLYDDLKRNNLRKKSDIIYNLVHLL